MTNRTFTQEELVKAASEFMKDKYSAFKSTDIDRYYSSFGLLYDFVTDLIPIEKDSDND